MSAPRLVLPVLPQTLPSGPLRITILIPHTLLHYLDPSIEENPPMTKYMTQDHEISRVLAKEATLNLGPVANTPRIREGYLTGPENDLWSLAIQIDCSVSGDEEELCVLSFQAKEELNDGKFEFAVRVRTAKPASRYSCFP